MRDGVRHTAFRQGLFESPKISMVPIHFGCRELRRTHVTPSMRVALRKVANACESNLGDIFGRAKRISRAINLGDTFPEVARRAV